MKNINSSEQFHIGEVQLSYKQKHPSLFSKITGSPSANECIRSFFPVDQISYREHMYVLYLNNANNVLGYQLISIGGITGTMVDIRVILQGALLVCAVGIILCHNHTSNKLTPSKADKELTSKIVKSAELLDIKVLDHLIVAENDYYSFADNAEM